jgi:hypothetical protein
LGLFGFLLPLHLLELLPLLFNFLLLLLHLSLGLLIRGFLILHRVADRESCDSAESRANRGARAGRADCGTNDRSGRSTYTRTSNRAFLPSRERRP